MNKSTIKKLCIYCNISLLLAAFISGLSFVAQKLGMVYVGPFTFNTLRCLIGCAGLFVILFLFNNYMGGKQREFYRDKNLLKGGVLAGVVLFIAFSINQYCMIYADAGKAGFITSLYIIFVPLLAVFLKHKLQSNVKISIAIALAGLYLLCAKDVMSFNSWDLWLLVSAFFFAVHIMILNQYSRKSNPIKLSALQFLVAGVLSAPFMFIFENPEITSIIEGWKPILFISLVVTAGAYTLQIFGHKAVKPVLATLILSSEAVFAVLCGVVILNETLSAREIVGCAVMFCAVIISQVPIKNVLKISNKEAKYGSSDIK